MLRPPRARLAGLRDHRLELAARQAVGPTAVPLGSARAERPLERVPEIGRARVYRQLTARSSRVATPTSSRRFVIRSESASERSRPPPSDAATPATAPSASGALAREEAHHPGERAELGPLREPPADDLSGARERLRTGDRRGERARHLAGAPAHGLDLLRDRCAVLRGRRSAVSIARCALRISTSALIARSRFVC